MSFFLAAHESSVCDFARTKLKRGCENTIGRRIARSSFLEIPQIWNRTEFSLFMRFDSIIRPVFLASLKTGERSNPPEDFQERSS